MSSSFLSLNMNGAIWIMVAYVSIYYGLARSVLARVNRMDPGCFEISKEDGGLPFGMKTSYTILEMVFDSELPEKWHGNFVRFGLYVVRVMFACYVPLFGFVLYLAWQ